MKKLIKTFSICVLLLIIVYGAGRLYYRVTAGFSLGNIRYDLPYDARWNVAQSDENELQTMLQQPFHYLGKGCQSYVFASEDGRYVLKFFKYQRFRPQGWLQLFSFIPKMEEYRQTKVEKKRKKLEGVFTSWKIAYEDLQPETGVIFVHLNKTPVGQKSVVILDKMGFRHELDLTDYEFLLQKRAKLLCPTLEDWMAQGKEEEAKQLLNRLVSMILSEYRRGFADNDHALMQNTGVIEGNPVHIDTGQFVKNAKVKNPKVSHQELFNKTWKFRLWLQERYPQLSHHLQSLLKEVMGEATFIALKPRLTRGGVGALSHQE